MSEAQIQSTTTEFLQSVTGQVWELNPYDERVAQALVQTHSVPDIIARLLSSRGITPEHAASFLSPSLRESLPDPSHLRDMDKAAARLAEAVEKQEKIVIFGDYDVDGATSSALLIRFFRAVGLEVTAYIPDRMKEGYGPNSEALLALKKQGADLVVTVDCGTVAYEPLAAAKEAGLEVIVIDHHLGGETLPEAVAVVNPNRLDETSEHRQLAAVGMCFLLAVAVNRVLREQGRFQERDEPDLLQLLDLVALGTVCDVVPLTGVNRAFVAQGLKIMARRNNLGLTILSDVARMTEPPGTYHAGFLLGPRINAGGRVGESNLGTTLLSTENKEEAETIAARLDTYNAERQAIESMVLEDAMKQAEKQDNAAIIWVAGKHWHQGVIGIVAGRLKERFNRPAIVLSLENGVGKASARSVSGVDMGAAITVARTQGMLLAGGGHAMAGGFSAEEATLPALRDFFITRLEKNISAYMSEKSLRCDGLLGVPGVNTDLANLLQAAGPYGMGNPEPRFILSNVRIVKSNVVGTNHVSCIITDGGPTPVKNTRLKGIAFRASDNAVGLTLLHSYGKDLHLAGKIKRNLWQGRESAEFHIEDVALA